jgi:hypothetical protein
MTVDVTQASYGGATLRAFLFRRSEGSNSSEWNGVV